VDGTFVDSASPRIISVQIASADVLALSGFGHRQRAAEGARLVNLIPISPFDGGRITPVLGLRVRLFGVPILIALFAYRPSPMLIVISLLAAPQVLGAWRTTPSTRAIYGLAPTTRLER
jgi:hypothetical protein